MNTTESSHTISPSYSPNALRAVWSGVRLTWDRLGLVLAISLTGSLAVMVLLAVWMLLGRVFPTVGSLLGFAFALMLVPPLFTGACHTVYLALLPDEHSYADFWRGVRQHYWLSLQLGFLQSFVLLLLGVNIGFYLAWRSPFAVFALVASLYALLLWLMMMLYQYPALVAQEAGLFDEPERKAKRGVLAVLRRSLFLTLGSPLYTFLVLVCLILLTLLSLVTAVLFVAVWGGLLAFVQTSATRELLMKYGILPLPTPLPPDEGFRLALPERKLNKEG